MRKAFGRKQRGLTLIELMVVIAITAVVALMTVQLSSGWTNGAKVSRAQATLQRAFSTVKSAAVQNNLAVTGDAVSASLCFTADRISAVVGGDCAATAFWSAAREAGVAIQVGSAGNGCIALNSAGIPVSAGSCATALGYSITAGNTNVQDKKLY